jgi:hypothetical protein
MGPPPQEDARGESVVIRESAADGTEYVATMAAIYHRNAALRGRSWRRIAWADVVAVHWCRSTQTATLQMYPDPGPRAVTLRLREHSRVAQFAAERARAVRELPAAGVHPVHRPHG